MTQHGNEQLIGIGAVAKALGVSRCTITDWEAAGVIPPAPFRLEPGSRRVWLASDVASLQETAKTRREANRQAAVDLIAA